MKRKHGVFFGIAVLLIAMMFTISGCDNGTNPGGGFVPVTDITGVPVIALVNGGLSLSGTVEPANATNKTITWTGDNVSNGIFTATSAGSSTVTATIANGASESSPYTKTFTITAYADTNPIVLAQGDWGRQVIHEGTTYTVKMTISGNNWKISVTPPGGSEIPDCKGIIKNVDTTTYVSQETHNHNGIDWVPHYSYDEGTYTLADSNNTLTLTSPGNPDSKAIGTWRRAPTADYLKEKTWECTSGNRGPGVDSITSVFSETNQITQTMHGGERNGKTVIGTYTVSGLTLTITITGGTLTGVSEVVPGTILTGTFDATQATKYTTNGIDFNRQL